MKTLRCLLLLISLAYHSDAQLVCGQAYPAENLRPDTITAWHFQDTLLPVSRLPHASAISNVSFKTDDYQFTYLWAPTQNIEAFALRTIAGMQGLTIMRRWRTDILGVPHEGILFRRKRRVACLLYEPGKGTHMYYINDIRYRKLSEVLRRVSKDLN
ncbi:MAG: hypothetical protein EOP49_30330 [Sphingobacteriales bacterium]|nr:MAG: hypothetical protein EOP49_30330 [Sphingobacteriales bacterium]